MHKKRTPLERGEAEEIKSHCKLLGVSLSGGTVWCSTLRILQNCSIAAQASGKQQLGLKVCPQSVFTTNQHKMIKAQVEISVTT